MAAVRVKRTVLKMPSIEDPERQVYKIEYRQGEAPPRFVFINAKEYTPELEAERIKEDIEKRQAESEETLEL